MDYKQLEEAVDECIFELSNAALGYNSEDMWKLLSPIPFYDLLTEVYVCLPDEWKICSDIKEKLTDILLNNHVRWTDEKTHDVEISWWNTSEQKDDEHSRRIAVYAQLFIKYTSQKYDKKTALLYKLVSFCSYWNDMEKSEFEERKKPIINQAKALLAYYNLQEEPLMVKPDPDELKRMFQEYAMCIQELADTTGREFYDFEALNLLEEEVISGYLNWSVMPKEEK